MTAFPANIARVSNLMSSRLALGQITRTNVAMLSVQQQIATGRSVLRPSDDVVKAAAIATLDDRLEYAQQRSRNLSHATAALGVLENSLAESTNLALQAKSIASDQLTPTSSAAERASQAVVVDEMLRSLFDTANRQGVAGYVFGGSMTSVRPVIEQLGGYRFVSDGPGLVTDLGVASSIPITLGAGNAVVATSSRVRGDVDFDPTLSTTTRLSDLGGARGLGVAPGVVRMAINGQAPIDVDLSDAGTVGEVLQRITNAVRAFETDQGVTVLGPGGVSVQGGAISVDLVAAGAGPPPTPAGSLRFVDVGEGTTAQDLGLAAASTLPPLVFDATTPLGVDVRPRLTLNSPIAGLTGVSTTPTGLGSIRISNGGRTALVDLSAATTIEDIKNAIEGTNLGVRVRINAEGTGIDVLNDLASASNQSLSIEEVGGNGLTATRLGIRTLTGSTRLSDFNFGRGVQIIDQATNPTTGLPDPALSADMVVVLGDAARTRITIDLRPQDIATVDTLLARINSEAAPQLAAAGLAPTAFQAGLGDGANGIVLRQDAAFATPIAVEKANNSPAAEQLGLTSGTWDAASATLRGSDRAKVRVDGLFNALLDLQSSLRGNDSTGIAIAGESVESVLDSLAETRGLVGSFAARVDQAEVREEDRRLVDETVRSGLRDTDYASAATRFALLQTQLQAALQTTVTAQSRTLLDFLG
jgi:flagellin-like hook-associated protein FlgL